MLCGECGTNVAAGAQFCAECGRRLPSQAGGSEPRLSVKRALEAPRQFRVTSRPGDVSVDIPWNRPFLVGRAVTCDLAVKSPTVSRSHAELTVTEDGLSVKDLGSSNGTYVNGVSVADAQLRDGDDLEFGEVKFRVEETTGGPPPKRERQSVQAGGAARRESARLARLVDLSRSLASHEECGAILERVVGSLLEVMEADRSVIALVADGSDALQTRQTGCRKPNGTDAGTIPRSIAVRCMEERVPLMADRPDRDGTLASASVEQQRVSSALCAPLLGKDGGVLGVCYVDNASGAARFDHRDLEYLVAASSIAAVALERERDQRISRS